MRIIAHFDMDAFFASIEERDRLSLRGRPIAVGADPKEGFGRGVVSTANYKAREYGIHSAQPISAAWRLSEKAKREDKPPVAFLGVNMEKYAEVSSKIMAIFRGRAPLVEEASIDEAYLDLSFAGSFEKAKDLCEKIKAEIYKKERLTASAGIGENKLIAKISSSVKKPDGLTIITPNETEKFLEPMPISKIPGVGPKTEAMFNNIGIQTVRDLRKLSKDELKKMLGKWGIEIYQKVRGIDDSPVIEEREIKSVGEQETFEEDTSNPNFISGRLMALCQNTIERLKKDNLKNFRAVTITIRFADFETKTRSRALSKPTNSLETLQFEAMKLLMPFLDKRENPHDKSIRLVAVRLEKLSGAKQKIAKSVDKSPRLLSEY